MVFVVVLKYELRKNLGFQGPLCIMNLSGAMMTTCTKHVELEAEAVPTTREGRKCNTRKDRDNRSNRHTCGILGNCFPYKLS